MNLVSEVAATLGWVGISTLSCYVRWACLGLPWDDAITDLYVDISALPGFAGAWLDYSGYCIDTLTGTGAPVAVKVTKHSPGLAPVPLDPYRELSSPEAVAVAGHKAHAPLSCNTYQLDDASLGLERLPHWSTVYDVLGSASFILQTSSVAYGPRCHVILDSGTRPGSESVYCTVAVNTVVTDDTPVANVEMRFMYQHGTNVTCTSLERFGIARQASLVA